MINFTVGPVQMCDAVREIGAEQVPYFRTKEFSDMMLENEKMLLDLAGAPIDARAVFLTASGTGAMEAAVINTLSVKDKALVVNGGSFGQRFVDLLTLHNIPFSEIKLKTGQNLTQNMLAKYDGEGYTAFLVNMHETSTGVLYDMNLISDFCKKNGLFLIVDAISAFLADHINMSMMNFDVMITSSQKALACPPGISAVILSPCGVKRVKNGVCPFMYLDLKNALNNAERGQTPFTPAVGILRQIHQRLKDIINSGGEKTEVTRTAELAMYFREKIKGLPFEIVPETMSNAVTALYSKNVSANEICLILKDEYNIWVCPNGGELKDIVFRVGHIGNLTKEDVDKLVSAFNDMLTKKLL